MFSDQSIKPTHAVLYTDGGCHQSVGIGGWGLHGYFYIDQPSKQGSGCKKAVPTKHGYVKETEDKFSITLTHYVDGLGSLMTQATNNTAELQGAIEALKVIEASGVRWAKLWVDSKYVLTGLTQWVSGWKTNGWKTSTGQPVANQELWETLHGLWEVLLASEVKLSLEWVKGHAGDFGNERVDQHATLATRAAINGKQIYEVTVKPAKGYWKVEKTRSRLFNQPVWYYSVLPDTPYHSTDGRTIYYCGELRAPVEFTGKMISNASFSVLYLKEPDPVLETIRQESIKLSQLSFYGLAVADLNVIFKPDNYDLIASNGTQFLNYDLSKNRLINFKKEVLVEELRPVRRAYYAVDKLMMLEGILKSYLSQADGEGYTFTSITDILYESVNQKKTSTLKLKASITQATRAIKATVDYSHGSGVSGQVEIDLLLAQDLPDRNTLSALAEEIVNVTVVTWCASDAAVRYHTIVETADDVGIWSGVYANLVMLPTSPA